MSVNLGFTPQALTVTLVAGSGFASALVADAGWPVGTTIRLEFDPGIPTATAITWPATVADTTAAWSRTPEQVDDVLALAPRSVVLRYLDGAGADVAWARGVVNAL